MAVGACIDIFVYLFVLFVIGSLDCSGNTHKIICTGQNDKGAIIYLLFTEKR